MLIQADYGFGFTNFAWILSPFVSVVVNGVLAAAHELTAGIAFSTWVAGQLLGTAALVWYVQIRGAGFGRPDRALARRALLFGYKWHLGRVLTFGTFRIDQWFVGAISGTRALGLYSIAVTWSEVLFYLPTALVIVQRPYLVRASSADAGRRALSVFRAATLLTVPLVALLVVFAPQLCIVFFGEEFRGSIVQLRVLALGAFGIVALKQLSNALTAQRRPGLATIAATLTFVATLALDVALIPGSAGLGAAVASTVSYTLGGVAVAAIFARIFGVSLSAFVPRPTEVSGILREAGAVVRVRRSVRASVDSLPDA
jgi:O-antigen/teichoic acid export membrane protein